MAIELFVENIEDVTEALRDEYEQVDGGYQLKAAKGLVSADKVEDVSGLKSALHKERDNGRNLARKLRQMEEQHAGIDMDEYNALKEAQAKAEEDRAKAAGEYDSLKNQLVTKHAEEKAAWEKERAEMQKGFSTHISNAAAAEAIAEHKGNPLFLKSHVLAATKVIQDDSGKYIAQIVDDAGNPRMNSDGKFLTVSDYVRELRENEAFGGAFIGTGSSGGGTPPGAGGNNGTGKQGGTPSNLKRGSMTPRQKVDFIKEHGEAEYLKLPD